MGKVRIAIVGVGNCASSLVQGLEYYKDADDGARVPGLMHVRFGPYHISDVEVVAAFDVDAKKVGCDLAEAITASENNTIKIAEVPPTGVIVQRGPTLDGLGEYYREIITESDEPVADVVQVLRQTGADVLVSYLPVGSEQADRYYAQCAIDARVAFVNALPVFIASDPEWAAKFTEAGVPIIGDDIKSQVGATITHRVLAKLFEDRGVELLRTYQLNFGGNMDFMNMLERSRLQSKKISKTRAVTSQVPHEMERAAVHIGPSDYVPWLDDRKMAYVRLEGRAFGDVPLNLEYKLEVWDSPNSAGVIIDAVRAAKIALDRGIGGPVISASSYFMKSPPEQYGDDVCRDLVEQFIRGEVARLGAPAAGTPKLNEWTSADRPFSVTCAPSWPNAISVGYSPPGWSRRPATASLPPGSARTCSSTRRRSRARRPAPPPSRSCTCRIRWSAPSWGCSSTAGHGGRSWSGRPCSGRSSWCWPPRSWRWATAARRSTSRSCSCSA
jgi:myo-inositol-1-phosphate synthase